MWTTLCAAGSLLRNQALAVLTAALIAPQEMLPEVAAQAMERHLFETCVGKVGSAFRFWGVWW